MGATRIPRCGQFRPSTHIIHPWPDQSFGLRHVRLEPCAFAGTYGTARGNRVPGSPTANRQNHSVNVRDRAHNPRMPGKGGGSLTGG